MLDSIDKELDLWDAKLGGVHFPGVFDAYCGTLFKRAMVGPDSCCSPHHRLMFNSRNEGSNALGDVARA